MDDDRTKLIYPPGMLLRLIIEGTEREIAKAKEKARNPDRGLTKLTTYLGNKEVNLEEELLSMQGGRMFYLGPKNPKRSKVIKYFESKFNQLLQDVEEANPALIVTSNKIYFINGIVHTVSQAYSETVDEGLLFESYFDELDPVQPAISGVAFTNPVNRYETLYQIWNIWGMEKIVVEAGKVDNRSLKENLLMKYKKHDLKV